MIKDMPVQQFLTELASGASTPGGGSAAAIMGAMGAALVSMVANLTVGKEKYADVEADVQILLDEAEQLRDELTEMIRSDVQVFDQVMAAYSMPKQTDEEKTRRSETIQSALRAATDVPLACAKLCRRVIRICGPVAEKGNANVISDAGVAVLAAHAALRSAALNVYINIGAIKDETFAADRRAALESLLQGAGEETEAIYEVVRQRL